MKRNLKKKKGIKMWKYKKRFRQVIKQKLYTSLFIVKLIYSGMCIIYVLIICLSLFAYTLFCAYFF